MNWWQRLTRQRQLENQLDAELRFDFERTVADYIRQGLSEADARRRAALAFGGLEQVKEKCRDARGTRWVETTAQDLRFAARQLRGNPAFTAVAVLALGLGIGANTAVFTVVNSVLLRPLPFPEADRLFLISHLPKEFPFHLGPSLMDRDYLSFREQDRVFEHVATFGQNPVNVTGAGEALRANQARVTPEFFAALGVNAALGRTFDATEDQPVRSQVAVLGNAFWRSRYGGDPQIVGRAVTLDGVPHQVIGVMPAGFNFPGGAQVWTPMAIHTDPHNSLMRPVVGRLRRGRTLEQAQAELKTLAHRWETADEEEEMKFTREIVPLQELLVGDVREMLVIFTGAVGFVLLIACANVANLLLIRAAARQHEVAVRAALGAGRWRLVRQMLTESTLVSLCGGAVGLALAVWGAPALVKLAPEGTIPRVPEIHIDGWVLLFAFAISALNGIVFGLAPAMRATRRPLRESINLGGRTPGGRRERLRSLLVVAEIALALVLLTGAGLMIKSFARMRTTDTGFHAGNVATMRVELPASVYRTVEQMREFRSRVLAYLAREQGVIAAASVDSAPLNPEFTMGDFHVEGRTMPPNYIVDKLTVSPGYFHAMGIRLEAGRDFADTDRAGAPGVVIISRSVARRIWPGENAVGKLLTAEDHPKPADWLTVIGVADEVKQLSLTRAADDALYQPYLQVARTDGLSRFTLVVRSAAGPAAVARSLRGALRSVDSQQPAQEIATMSELMAQDTAEPLFEARLLGGFAAMALVLAALGIYGVLAYAVTERTREIGIRMALGAGRGEVIRMVLRRAAVLAAAGVALGAAGALAVTKALEKLLFEVRPNDPATFVAVAALLAAVAALAALVPARRATKVDPLIALRYE